jgi:hypothetical protein
VPQRSSTCTARKGDQNRMLFDAMLRWTWELNPDFCR